MIYFGVEWDDDRFERAMRKTPVEIFRAFRMMIARYLTQFRGIISRSRLRGAPGLRRRTGFLAQSQKTVVTGTSTSTLRGEYAIGGGVVKYARIHEEGGVIRPTRAKFLAIPLEAAKTAAGVGRAVSPRDFQNTFVRKGIIWQRLAPGAKTPRGASSNVADRSLIVPLFLLRRQVKIEPRLGVADEWKADRPRRLEMLRAAIAEAIRRAGL